MTKDSLEFHVIPDDAICLQTMISPEIMDSCPLKNFDDFGDICIPELCTFYCETCGKLLGDQK